MVGIGKENLSRPVPLNSLPVAPVSQLSPDFFQVSQTLVGEDAHGQRLDNFLFRIAHGVPKSHIYRIVRSGQVRVNGRRVDNAYRLQTGDVLRIPPLHIARREEACADEIMAGAQLKAALPILYEDAALLVINKPAGLAVHGGSGVSFGVIEALRRQRPQAKFLELAHRLDRETSGILLVGKKRSALTVLHDMFRESSSGHGERRVDKRYFVLVAGPCSPAVIQVLARIGRTPRACRHFGQAGAHGISPAGALGKFQPAGSGVALGTNASDSCALRRDGTPDCR